MSTEQQAVEADHAEYLEIRRLRALPLGRITVNEALRCSALERGRRRRLAACTPRLSCCAEIRLDPAIHLVVRNPTNEDPRQWAAEWQIRERRYTAKFCLFCGTAVPVVRLREILPMDLCRRRGEHCLTCGDYLGTCYCDPPETAFVSVGVVAVLHELRQQDVILQDSRPFGAIIPAIPAP